MHQSIPLTITIPSPGTSVDRSPLRRGLPRKQQLLRIQAMWIMRGFLLTPLALAIAFIGTMKTSAQETSDWPTYLQGPEHSSYNQLATAITPANASTLVQNWSFADRPPTHTGQPGVGFNASPTVNNGVIYIGSNTGQFYAINESTGRVLWHSLLGYTTGPCRMQLGITSTATVATDPISGTLTVYVGGGNGYLYALNAATGAIVWKHLVVNTGTDGYIWGSPLVFNSGVYIGVSSQCFNPPIRGGIKSFDQHTGAPLHTYWTTPSGTVGASVWTSAASDQNFVWLTVGDGDSGDSFAIVRLSTALTFQTKWTVPNTTGTDLDWGSSPTLFEATLDSVPTQMVGANQKNGIFYAFNAIQLENGPVWSLQVGVPGQLRTLGSCLAAPVWDFTNKRLFVGSNKTTIQSVDFAGSLRSLDPATGAILWETGLSAGPVMGSPTLSGGGVLAAGTYSLSAPTQNAVYLLDASNGNILTTFPETSPVFAQPVFADTHLFVATSGGTLYAFSP
jgi:outer membrane protein assembly factor BamB